MRYINVIDDDNNDYLNLNWIIERANLSTLWTLNFDTWLGPKSWRDVDCWLKYHAARHDRISKVVHRHTTFSLRSPITDSQLSDPDDPVAVSINVSKLSRPYSTSTPTFFRFCSFEIGTIQFQSTLNTR